MSWAPDGPQKIYYTKNNYNELNVMETYVIFLVSQQNQSNKTTRNAFDMHNLFWDTLYK